jgi:hypothetical protein
MRTRHILLIVLALLVIAGAAAAGYLLWQRGRQPSLAQALAEARASQSAPRQAPTPAPTPTPDAAGVGRLLADPVLAQRLAAARTLPARQDIPVAERAALLTAALAAEVANPSADASRVRDTYLPPGDVLRLVVARSLSELGEEALPAVRQAAETATGSARAHLLVALAYLGDRDVLPEVRQVLGTSGDPVVRMDAARALGIAADQEAIPDLVEALADPYVVTARDSLGEFTIYPVREQAVGALAALGVAVTRQSDDTFVVEGDR